MRSDEIRSLDLVEKHEIFLRNELEMWALENPERKFDIIYWIDDIVTKSVQIINDYLVDNECPERLKTGGDIIGKDRSTFFRLTKKEVL